MKSVVDLLTSIEKDAKMNLFDIDSPRSLKAMAS